MVKAVHFTELRTAVDAVRVLAILGAGSYTDPSLSSGLTPVKAGHLSPGHLRDLRGVLDREHAEIGALLCMEEPTGPMRKEAASAGFYKSPVGKASKAADPHD